MPVHRSRFTSASVMLVTLALILVVAFSASAQSSISHPMPATDYTVEKVGHETKLISRPAVPQGNGTWTLSSATNAPIPAYGSTAVWTGSEMIVWGGQDSAGMHNAGGRYNPSTDTWQPTSTTNAPESRFDHTAIWTGKEMLIWGCVTCGINSGGSYDPSTDQWHPITATGAPPARYFGYKAVWTGHQMMVWGISSSQGALYDPAIDQWTPITTTGAPPAVPSAYSPPTLALVWTGKEAIVFYSLSENGQKSGGRYNPETDTWSPISLINAPLVEYKAAVAWTGQEMMVYGGVDADGSPGPNLGARYSPQSDTWLDIPADPILQGTTIGLWDGVETVFMGVDNYHQLNGARYDPIHNAWRDLPQLDCVGSPEPFGNGVWTGNEILTWGAEGGCVTMNSPLPALRFTIPYRSTQVFNADSDTYIAQGHTAESFGTDPIMFSGYDPRYGYLTERMLVRFPVWIPVRTNFEQAAAYLYMYGYNNGAAPMSISAHRATSPWSENSTWQSSANNFDATPSSAVSIGTAFGWYGWDVTATARKWLSGTPNYGLMLNGNSAGSWNERVFLAREAGADVTPVLAVTYADPAYAPDSTPPTASLNLPALHDYRTPLTVEWDGHDYGRGIQTFDVQVREQPTGTWNDWYSWAVGRSANFTGEAGHAYCFRVRARDYAGNVGIWSTDNRCTTFYAYAVTGQIADHRHTPVANADLQVHPSALTMTINALNGQYAMYFADGQPRQITVTQSAYTAPPVANLTITSTDHYDFVMQPSDNVILNSNLESGLTNWAMSGALPISATRFSHSGSLAVALNSDLTSTTGIATFGQEFVIPTADAPQILSFMYNLTTTSPLSNSQLVVTLATIGTTSTIWSTQAACTAWCHTWIDVSTWRGQAVTLTIALDQESGEVLQASLDEIVLGSWQTPIIEQVTPSQIEAHVSTRITLTGQNFLAEPLGPSYITGPVVLLNMTPVQTYWISTTTLAATVPSTMPVGLYTVWVDNPGDFRGALPDSLRIGHAVMLPIIAKNQ